MAGYFELKKSKNGQFFFNLVASNKQVVLTSEKYKTKAAAENGMTSVKKNARVDSRFERLNSTSKKPYFVLKAANGEVVGRSQMYASSSSRSRGIKAIARNASGAKVQDLTK